MGYRVDGVDAGRFVSLLGLSPSELADRHARWVVADSDRGYFCRVSLSEAAEGERVLLAHHLSHDVASPFRFGYAVYVREGAREAARLIDRLPAMFERAHLALRGFDAEGMLVAAVLAAPGEAERQVAALLDAPRIAYIDAHFGAHGCFAARIERN